MSEFKEEHREKMTKVRSETRPSVTSDDELDEFIADLQNAKGTGPSVLMLVLVPDKNDDKKTQSHFRISGIGTEIISGLANALGQSDYFEEIVSEAVKRHMMETIVPRMMGQKEERNAE